MNLDKDNVLLKIMSDHFKRQLYDMLCMPHRKLALGKALTDLNHEFRHGHGFDSTQFSPSKPYLYCN